MSGALGRRFSGIFNPISKERTSTRYTVATLAGVLAILLRWVLDPILGHVAFYVTIYIAVVYCAIVCGYAPAAWTGAFGFVGIFYWFVDPRHSLYPARPNDIHGVVGFFLVSVVLIALGEANRNKQLRLNKTVIALTREAKNGKTHSASCFVHTISSNNECRPAQWNSFRLCAGSNPRLKSASTPRKNCGSYPCGS